jgi:signal transduction histidine kinase
MPLSFPDEPRGGLDKALDDLMTSAREVLGTQGRLRALLRANSAIIEHLDLPVVLQRITEAAVELVGAKYGALGVLSPEGGLEQFITIGMTPEEIEAIGHLPKGHGLLGALIDNPHSIRIPTIADHPLSVGFPEGHPPMDSFLGVPIRVRDEVYGNLYLSNHIGGAFTAEDEQLLTALAATAGIAIENARLYSETQRRQAWADASAELAAALLAGDDGQTLTILCTRVLDLTAADAVYVLLPTDDAAVMRVTIARGVDEERMTGGSYALAGTAAEAAIAAGHPHQLDERSSDQPTCALAAPFRVSDTSTAVLVAVRFGVDNRFARGDLGFAADLARQASVAMELAAARSDRQRMELIEDRGRIARDLHDHVIQQLFGTGLELQAIASSGVATERIMQAVEGIDASISHIRTIIFALSSPSSASKAGVRQAILELVKEVAPSLAHTPTVHFAGPVDLVLTDDLADDVVAVTREALMNVVKHASAENTTVSLALEGAGVELRITDDGHGARGAGRRSGVANLERRALLRGGSFEFDSDATGTRLLWAVPVESESMEPS